MTRLVAPHAMGGGNLPDPDCLWIRSKLWLHFEDTAVRRRTTRVYSGMGARASTVTMETIAPRAEMETLMDEHAETFGGLIRRAKTSDADGQSRGLQHNLTGASMYKTWRGGTSGDSGGPRGVCLVSWCNWGCQPGPTCSRPFGASCCAAKTLEPRYSQDQQSLQTV